MHKWHEIFLCYSVFFLVNAQAGRGGRAGGSSGGLWVQSPTPCREHGSVLGQLNPKVFLKAWPWVCDCLTNPEQGDSVDNSVDDSSLTISLWMCVWVNGWTWRRWSQIMMPPELSITSNTHTVLIRQFQSLKSLKDLHFNWNYRLMGIFWVTSRHGQVEWSRVEWGHTQETVRLWPRELHCLYVNRRSSEWLL